MGLPCLRKWNLDESPRIDYETFGRRVAKPRVAKPFCSFSEQTGIISSCGEERRSLCWVGQGKNTWLLILIFQKTINPDLIFSFFFSFLPFSRFSVFVDSFLFWFFLYSINCFFFFFFLIIICFLIEYNEGFCSVLYYSLFHMLFSIICYRNN